MQYLRLDSLPTSDVGGQVRIAGILFLTINIPQLLINRVSPFVGRRLCAISYWKRCKNAVFNTSTVYMMRLFTTVMDLGASKHFGAYARTRLCVYECA
jgi:hypothetical protein